MLLLGEGNLTNIPQELMPILQKNKYFTIVYQNKILECKEVVGLIDLFCNFKIIMQREKHKIIYLCGDGVDMI